MPTRTGTINTTYTMNQHIQTQISDFVMLIKTGSNSGNFLSSEKIEVGDEIYLPQITAVVKSIEEVRPQIGKFNDESKRRTFYKLTWQ